MLHIDDIPQQVADDMQRQAVDLFPAMWEPFRGIVGKSVFENIGELLNELKAEPEYKQYF